MRINTLLKGYFLWSILFLLIACNGPGEKKKVPADPKNSEWYAVPGSKLNGQSNKLDMYVLRFYEDGSYVLCADLLYEQGRWNFDNENKSVALISSTPGVKKDIKYLFDNVSPKGEIVFTFSNGSTPNNSALETVEVQAVTNQSSYDPYNSLTNAWRKKPLKEETPEEIKARAVAYLKFLEALYAHAIDNDLENTGGTWYPKPVKFFSNKVAMAYNNELIDWYACFYNEAQGIEAYKIISGALMKVKIEGPDDNSRNLNCVRQMIQLIQKT